MIDRPRIIIYVIFKEASHAKTRTDQEVLQAHFGLDHADKSPIGTGIIPWIKQRGKMFRLVLDDVCVTSIASILSSLHTSEEAGKVCCLSPTLRGANEETKPRECVASSNVARRQATRPIEGTVPSTNTC